MSSLEKIVKASGFAEWVLSVLCCFSGGRVTYRPALDPTGQLLSQSSATYPRSLVGVHTLCVGSVSLISVWFSDIPAASAIVSETQELLQKGEREGVR